QQEAIALRQGIPARSQSGVCWVGPPDVVGRVAPPTRRRHDRVEVLPQVGVLRYEAMYRDGAIVELPAEQLLADRRNAKRAVFALQLDRQPGRGLQPAPDVSDGRQLIGRKVTRFAEMPAADDDAHYLPPASGGPSAAAVPPTIVISVPMLTPR